MNYLQNKYNISRHLLETLLQIWNIKVYKSCICSINSWWQSCAGLLS